jgi:hypothetical protein
MSFSLSARRPANAPRTMISRTTRLARTLGTCMSVALLAPGVAAGDLVVENQAIRVVISDQTGAVRKVVNKLTGQDLLARPSLLPFRYARVAAADYDNQQHRLPEQQLASAWQSFSYQRLANGVILTWDLDGRFVLESTVEARPGAREATFTPRLLDRGGANDPQDRINLLLYPMLDQVGRFHGGATDCLLAGNYLWREPTVSVERLVLAWFEQDTGGFYLGMHDPLKRKYDPGFLAFHHEPASNTFRFRGVHRNTTADQSVELGYPVVISALSEGNWYEAAETYRRWVTTGPWCAKGRLYDRVHAPVPTASRWLAEEVGFCSFGLASDAAYSQRAFEGMAAVADIPVFHVLGYDWANSVAGMPYDYFGGMDTYSPPSFYQQTIQRLQAQGDHFAPFVFDFFFHIQDRLGPAMSQSAVLSWFGQRLRVYTWWLMCSQTAAWEHFHADRDRRHVSWGADASYYDISETFECWDPTHGHPLGTIDRGRIYAASRTEASRARGSYFPIGKEYFGTTELPSHHRWADEIDYFQSREGAGPAGGWEAQHTRAALLQGRVVRVPFVDFALHEYGPVRMDGWANLSAEWGNIFWWVAAGNFLDGALFQLNYEFAASDLYPGMTAADAWVLRYPDGVYVNDAVHAHQVDPARAAFVKEGARARTEFARPYLAYGSMTRPARHDSTIRRVPFDFWFFNLPDVDPDDEMRGTFDAEEIIERGWIATGAQGQDRRLAYLWANLGTTSRPLVNVVLDPLREGFLPGRFVAFLVSSDGCVELARFTDSITLPRVDLRPRRIEMIEIVPEAKAPPAAVTGMRATGFNDAVLLSWTTPPGATGVRVVRKEGRFFPRGPEDGAVVFQGLADRWADTGVAPGRSYRYAAFAYDASGHCAHGDVDSARATGAPVPPSGIRLALAQPDPRVDVSFDLTLDAPADAGRFYLVPAAWGASPGTFLSGSRWIGLNFDPLFIYSLDSTNPTFVNSVGMLDPQGRGKVTVTIPGHVGLPSYTFYFAGLTVDLSAPDGIGRISPTLRVDVAH